MKIEEQVLSRGQMKHLQELGVDTSDASMIWYCCDNKWYLQINYELSQGIARIMKGTFDCFVPTYTIGDLIEKLPKGIEGNYLYIKYGWEYGYERIHRRLYVIDYSHIERLYELFCWIAENHKELIK